MKSYTIFIQTTCFGRQATIIRSKKELKMQRTKDFFRTQWDPIVFTLLYKTL
jgi:hypothetical protein